MTATVTSDFRHEFDQERTRWIRKRVLWYLGVSIVIALIFMIPRSGWLSSLYVVEAADPALESAEPGAVAEGPTIDAPGVVVAVDWGLKGLNLAILVIAAIFVARRALSREALLGLVHWIILLSAGLPIVTLSIILRVHPPSSLLQEAQAAGDPEVLMGAAIGGMGLWSIFIAHFFAALFIPWSPREAIKPLLPLLGLFALTTAFLTPGPLGIRITFILVAPLVGAPGLAIAWWRHSRFRQKFHYRALRGVYGDMKRELMDARRIHEALFPPPITEGPVRLDYRYEPAKHIGGDFLYTHRFPGLPGETTDGEPLSVLLLDVTGHGIPAALTVNRLHGELDRLFAEEPDISPGDALAALNHYVHLTMANHSVFATALCLRVDPSEGTVRWASAGHPPAFLRSVDGRIERLESTSFVLGACGLGEFDSAERTARFAEGDTIIAYTDGAMESRDELGAMLRVEGLQSILLSVSPRAIANEGWAAAMLQKVESRRYGPAADDTLFVELYRPVHAS